MIRPVPNNATGSLCAGGMIMPVPFANMRMAINGGSTGAPFPVTCRWAVLIGMPPGPGGVLRLVWSDTVTVIVTRAP